MTDTDCRDAHYMGLALAQARQAASAGEVPVGAVLVQPAAPGREERILALAHNRPLSSNDPTAHAEILALRQAADRLGNYRLDGCELYVTLEPCAMCAQALLHARISRVVYGAREPKTGAAGSVIDVFGHPQLNHHTDVVGGVEAQQCAELMQVFFRGQRARSKTSAVPLRDDALRTPEPVFEPLWAALPDWRSARRWFREGDALDGLQLHWMDFMVSDPVESRSVLVPLHGPGGWWPEWSAWIVAQRGANRSVAVPDLVGHGHSDKPKKARWHTLAHHAAVLADWLRHLNVSHVYLVPHPDQTALAAEIARRLEGIGVAIATAVPEALKGLPPQWREVPYPDSGHRAAMKSWPWPAS